MYLTKINNFNKTMAYKIIKSHSYKITNILYIFLQFIFSYITVFQSYSIIHEKFIFTSNHAFTSLLSTIIFFKIHNRCDIVLIKVY